MNLTIREGKENLPQYVYTVTPTTISEATGSPYKVENAYGLNGLAVFPKL